MKNASSKITAGAIHSQADQVTPSHLLPGGAVTAAARSLAIVAIHCLLCQIRDELPYILPDMQCISRMTFKVLPCILPECAALFLSACLSRRLETTLSGGEVIVSLASWIRNLHAVRWQNGLQNTTIPIIPCSHILM